MSNSVFDRVETYYPFGIASMAFHMRRRLCINQDSPPVDKGQYTISDIERLVHKTMISEGRQKSFSLCYLKLPPAEKDLFDSMVIELHRETVRMMEERPKVPLMIESPAPSVSLTALFAQAWLDPLGNSVPDYVRLDSGEARGSSRVRGQHIPVITHLPDWKLAPPRDHSNAVWALLNMLSLDDVRRLRRSSAYMERNVFVHFMDPAIFNLFELDDNRALLASCGTSNPVKAAWDIWSTVVDIASQLH